MHRASALAPWTTDCWRAMQEVRAARTSRQEQQCASIASDLYRMAELAEPATTASCGSGCSSR